MPRNLIWDLGAVILLSAALVDLGICQTLNSSGSDSTTPSSWTTSKKPNSVGCQKVNIAFLIDSSDSTVSDLESWLRVQWFVMNVVVQLNVGPNDSWVAVATYATDTEVIFPFNTSQSKYDLYRVIEMSQPLWGSSTNTAGGLRALLAQFSGMNASRPGVRNVAVVLAGRRSNFNVDDTLKAADDLRLLNVEVLVVGTGITRQPDIDELQGIADKPQNLILVSDHFSLAESVDRIVELQCIPSPLNYDCSKRINIALILDRSEDLVLMQPNYWNRDVLGFASSLVKRFNVGLNLTQFGVVTFGSSAESSIYFNNYTDVNLLLPAIRNIASDEVGKNKSAGLMVTDEELFNIDNGYIQGGVDVAVLVTHWLTSSTLEQTLQMAEKLKERVELFVVAAGLGFMDEELVVIASSPANTHYFFTEEWAQLDSLVSIVASAICNATGVTTLGTTQQATDNTSTQHATGTATSQVDDHSSSKNDAISVTSGDPQGSSPLTSPTVQPATQPASGKVTATPDTSSTASGAGQISSTSSDSQESLTTSSTTTTTPPAINRTTSVDTYNESSLLSSSSTVPSRTTTYGDEDVSSSPLTTITTSTVSPASSPSTSSILSSTGLQPGTTAAGSRITGFIIIEVLLGCWIALAFILVPTDAYVYSFNV